MNAQPIAHAHNQEATQAETSIKDVTTLILYFSQKTFTQKCDPIGLIVQRTSWTTGSNVNFLIICSPHNIR